MRGDRNQTGAASITEFGAVLLMILFLVLPFLNLAIIPVRYAVAKSIVSTEARNLAKCETFSEAIKTNLKSKRLSSLRELGGIRVVKSQLTLVVEEARSKIIYPFTSPRSIPQQLLPDGKNNFAYYLELTVDVEIHPLIATSNGQTQIPDQARIPGLTGPIRLKVQEVAAWENLSRDPMSGEFFLNL